MNIDFEKLTEDQMNALEKKIKSNHPEIFEKYQIPEEEKKEEKKEAKKEEVKA